VRIVALLYVIFISSIDSLIWRLISVKAVDSAAKPNARLKMGFLAYNLLHLIRRFYLWGEDARRSIEWIITRLVKAGARIVYHARRWYVHVASAFPLGHHYRAVLGWQC
jgi:hypothetical protein